MTERPPDDMRSGWSRRDQALVAALLVVLVGLFALRAETRRPDPSRVPRGLDVLVLHVGGLRADAVSVADLASDLGMEPSELLVFELAFAPSGDARRSLLSALRGDLVLNLDAAPGPGSLAFADGWHSILVTEGDTPAGAREGFDVVVDAASRSATPDALTSALREAGDGPVLAVVHLGGSAAPLHTDTTSSGTLQGRYAALVVELRGTIARLAQAASVRDRPLLVVAAGANGMELGEHPETPDRPWDSHLRVPFVLGLKGAAGLPTGPRRALVSTADLAPTVLDLLDARTTVIGTSLEPFIHGWEQPPVHPRLVFADRHFAGVRTEAWKLIVPVAAPWRPQAVSASLYALEEDPGETWDLAKDRRLGPVGEELLAALVTGLRAPETVGSAP